jgi:asparagine synthase (glutamine-hydrolysing)
MCGIAGFVEANGRDGGANEASARRLRQMCDVIRHRGPDDEGMFVGDGAALGMRRLSIIDLAGGHQPIRNEDGTIWVVFNGEIYNYRELRAELAASGHAFYTDTDTETIVHAYEQWGDEAFTHMRGMFGIALWDRRTRTLLLARDRVGIKPLHYAEHDGRLSFGSEIKSILAGGGARSLNPPALGHYLSFQYTPGDASMFDGIRKLPPGHVLRWHDGHLTIRRYWSVPAGESFAGSLQDATDALTTILADAVQSHLVSDVPIGALLSGGVDSSLVVGLMARASSRPIKTFSIGFDEPAFDELDAARRLAQHFSTDHHELVVRPDALGVVGSLVEHFDEPFGDSSAVPTWYVCQMARRHVTVVLSGDGGDELFGGYDRYLPHRRVASFDSLAGSAGRAVAGLTWPLLPHGRTGKNFLRHVAQRAGGRYLDSIRLFQPDELTALLSAAVGESIDVDAAGTLAAARFEQWRALPWPSQMMHFDLDTYLPEDILTKVDRMSMAHSIESRVPLLDHNVVAFAASLPHDMKIRHSERKRVLKLAAASILPAEVLGRRKQGFGVPVGEWFRGPLKDFLADALQSARARQRGYFRPRFVDRLMAEHMSGRRDHTARLWALLMFELWHRRYLDGSSGDDQGAQDSRLPFGRVALPIKDNTATGVLVSYASSERL